MYDSCHSIISIKEICDDKFHVQIQSHNYVFIIDECSNILFQICWFTILCLQHVYTHNFDHPPGHVHSDFRTSFFLGSTIFCTTTRKPISILFTKSKTLTLINLCLRGVSNWFAIICEQKMSSHDNNIHTIVIIW